MTFNKEARARYVDFATSPTAAWTANFRDFAASITRMATLAPSGRINEELVSDEIERLRRKWTASERTREDDVLESLLGAEKFEKLDLFDRMQLALVVATCRTSRSLSDAGRRLFAVSREEKSSTNDADRLKKYLARFGLTWAQLCE